MGEDKYNIFCDEHLVATNVRLEDTMIFAKALFEHYYAQPGLKVTIERTTEYSCGEDSEYIYEGDVE